MRKNLGDDVGGDDFDNDSDLAGAARPLTVREVFGNDVHKQLRPAVACGRGVSPLLRLACIASRPWSRRVVPWSSRPYFNRHLRTPRMVVDALK